MKIRLPFLSLILAWGVCLLPSIFVTMAADTNEAVALISKADLGDLHEKLRAMQRSDEDAIKIWDGLIKQNAALSNHLAGLHQSLLTQQERELELGKEANAFNLKVLAGAGAAICLVIILSFWFQMRCFNRVIEISRANNGMHGDGPALLGGDSSASRLLGAVKLLENRIQQLEYPAGLNTSSNAIFTEDTVTRNGEETTSILAPPQEKENPKPSDSSLLLAKGEILLDMDRLEEAVNCFQEALTVDPGNAEAHFKKGIALERLNRLEPSLTAYEEALRLNPKRAIAYVYKARVLQGLHRYDEALSVYDSAMGKNSGKVSLPSVSN